MPLAWSSIEENPRYQGLSEADKARVRDGYNRRYGTRRTVPSDSDPTRGSGVERTARLARLTGHPTEEEAAALAADAQGGMLRRLGESFVSGASESTTGRAVAALGGPTPVHVEPRTAPERIARGVGGITGSPFIIAGSALGPAGTAAGFGAEEVARGALEGKPPLKIAKQAGGAALLGGAVGVAGPSLRALGGEAAAALAGGGPVQAGVRFLARHGIPIAGEAGVFGVGGEALAPLTEGRPAEAGKALEATTETAGMMGVLHGLGAIDRLRARLAPAGRAGVGKAPAIPPAAPVAPGPSPGVVPQTTPVQPSAEAAGGGGVGRAAVLRGEAVEGSTPGVPGAGEVQPVPGTAAPAIAVAPAPNNVMERAKLAADAEKGGQVAGAAPLPVHPASRPVAEGPPIPPAVQSVRADAAAAERAGDMDKAGRLRTLADAMLDAYRRKSGPPPTDLTVTPGGVAGPPGQPAYPVPAVLPEGAQPSRLPGEPQPEQIDLRERLLQMAQQRRAQQTLGAPPGPP